MEEEETKAEPIQTTKTQEFHASEPESPPDGAPVDNMLETQKLESLGVLAGGIAHDFNNILTGVVANVELALASLAPDVSGRDYVVEIEAAAHRAADLSCELLAYAGRGSFEVEPVNLSELVEESMRLITMSLVNKPSIAYDLAENLDAIEADTTQVRQILLNLVTNAAEAISGADGSISVRTFGVQCNVDDLGRTDSNAKLVPGHYICLEVSDSGTGMDEETRNNIFKPFFTTKLKGRGLGLAAVLGILQSHKGAIQVTSEPGKGTTIAVLFPATDKPVAPSVQPEPDDGAWRGTGTVLIVDDQKAVLSVASRIVERLGFDVLTAADGREALETLKRHPDDIDLALVDLTMPRLDGVQAIREMRDIQRSLKTILMSGYYRQEMETRYADCGITGFIQKPFGEAALRAQVRSILAVSTRSAENSAGDEAKESDAVTLLEEQAACRKLSSGFELAQYDTALRLTRAVENKSNKTAGRLSRISRMAADLSRKLEVSEDEVQVLAAAAPFHDIGEIGVSEQVLRKPGPLSDEEWRLIKRHPVVGSELLSGLSSEVMGAASEIALNHHERWDGSGYPNGLAGRDIPLFARIVALVDQYDAIRSPRPYRPALSHQQACNILLRGDARTEAGRFDPDVLSAFDTMQDRFADVFDAYQHDAQPEPGLNLSVQDKRTPNARTPAFSDL